MHTAHSCFRQLCPFATVNRDLAKGERTEVQTDKDPDELAAAAVAAIGAVAVVVVAEVGAAAVVVVAVTIAEVVAVQ